MAAGEPKSDNIRKFEEIGTHPSANALAIAEALTFHEGIGPERKAARLRYLFHRWAKRLDGMKGVKVLTPFDPKQSCGLANVSIAGLDHGKLGEYLMREYRIITTPIKHEEYEGIRITPNVYTTAGEIDTFAEVMERVILKGLPS
jgi:selenocysteine lyase/cysteine desulfurase